MKNKSTILIGVLAIAGLVAILSTFYRQDVATVQDELAEKNQSQELQDDLYQPGEEQSEISADSEEPQNSGVILNSKDMENIAEIAKMNLDEALNSYAIYADQVLKEAASNEQHLHVLLTATLELSEVDGANDHYVGLAKIWDKYPDNFKKGLDSLSATANQKNEILQTVKSVSDSLKHGNG